MEALWGHVARTPEYRYGRGGPVVAQQRMEARQDVRHRLARLLARYLQMWPFHRSTRTLAPGSR
jgi:hypothetical protein